MTDTSETKGKSPAIRFSVVIPVFNEKENISELHQRLTAVLEGLCSSEDFSSESFEIICVDDGSTDSSWRMIQETNKLDPRFKGISFSRNFGHHIAITAGIDHARGETVILMDGDLQDPPEEIPKLYAKYLEGFDLVYGIRTERRDPFLKRISSTLFWWILQKFSGVDMPQGQTMLRILSPNITAALRQMRERARFIHGMMAWTGFRTATIEVKHAARARGMSKYTVARMFRLAFHAVTSFSTVPLRLAVYLGFISSFLSLLVGIYFIWRKLILDIPVLGYASIIVAVFFMGGIQLLVLGIFGEYIGRTYQESQQRPLYLLKETLL